MYYLIYGLLYLISLLPFFILYRISDLAYFILYYLFGYRKKVVMHNLDIAFPEKSSAEKNRIAREFYALSIEDDLKNAVNDSPKITAAKPAITIPIPILMSANP